jgi:hypothetical protein
MLKKSFFVIRAKENMQFKRMYSRAVDKTTGVIYDQIGSWKHKSKTEYPEKLEESSIMMKSTKRTFVFLPIIWT